MVEEAQALKYEFSALAAGGSPANRAYLERLSKAAEIAAAKGYGIKRATHTVQRTRMQKTTNTTDLRSGNTETKKDCITRVDEWFEDGSPTMTGVGVMYGRGYRTSDKYSDGSVDVHESTFKGETRFFPSGDKNSVCTKTFNYSNGPQSSGPSAAWPGMHRVPLMSC